MAETSSAGNSSQRAQPCTLRARPVALRRCFNNLVENAIRYGGSAEIAIRDLPDAVEVTVDDRGPGIPEDRLQDVFRPFVRLEESRNRDSGGAGLGLAIARSVVLAHGGSIVLANRPEGGLQRPGPIAQGGLVRSTVRRDGRTGSHQLAAPRYLISAFSRSQGNPLRRSTWVAGWGRGEASDDCLPPNTRRCPRP